MKQPRPEYPRPQFVRDRWLNLNGRWEFEFDPGQSGAARGLPAADSLSGEILVPFCPESSLSGIGDIDFHPGVWYRRVFTVPSDWSGQRILLHIGASDHDTAVWINGKFVGEHSGGYTPFSADITGRLERGENVITINAQDDTRSPWVLAGKQCPDYASRRCHYTRTTGIWQTVWIEPVPSTYIGRIEIHPQLSTGHVAIEAILNGADGNGILLASVSREGSELAEERVAYQGGRAVLMIQVPEPEPWSPQDPALYDLDITLHSEKGASDTVRSYFGFRSLALVDGAIHLNGKPLFQRLVLDQGFYPDGIYTAPDDQALRNDIAISQEMGFNGARLHQKLFEPRFLYWADRMGYLVWDEFPNWGLDVSHPKALAVFLPQWLEAMQRDINHPSIVGWCPFNETQRDQDPDVIRDVYRATKAVDPTRPVIDTSGFQHVETDIYDVHNYEQAPEVFAEAFAAFAQGGEPYRNRPELDAPYAGQPYFVSEYGGIWWDPDQRHNGWGYGDRPNSASDFLARYEALTETLLKHPRICAFCYTQLYDIEQEVNGLYTYDRRPKFDADAIRGINTQSAVIEG